MTIKLKTCPYCSREFPLSELPSDFEFELEENCNYPNSGCCNLCGYEVTPACEMDCYEEEEETY